MHNRQQAVGQPALDMPRQIEQGSSQGRQGNRPKELVASLQLHQGFGDSRTS
jgi:hypothetical protein